ncbi:MAG: hypothetical protein D6754_06900 [Alphaproteobacteria bacterium]|nr:MAG: hypothetical protein D6754_06900 [Alphaproteobacteria bacterium]
MSIGVETVAYSCSCPACAASGAQDGSVSAGPGIDRPQAQTATGTSFTAASVTGGGKDLGDYILSGYKWATTSLTYSFTDSTSDYSYNDHAGQFSTLNAMQRAAARDAFDMIAAYTGVSFTELTGTQDRNADLRLAEGGEPSTAWAYYPSSGEWGGDMWFNPSGYNAPVLGTYAYTTFLHEAGHAMGLKHGHESGFAGALPAAYDSHEYSLMTYHSAIGGGLYYTNANGSGPQSYMMADIRALQTMYGANFDTNAGDTTYSFSTETGEMFVDGAGQGAASANVVFRTVWDGNGTDTYDFSNYTTDLAIDLAPGGFSDLDVGGNFQRARLSSSYWARGHLFNALQFEGDARSLIENALGGSGNDSIEGNAADNSLSGGAGNDTLAGVEGNDTLDGGAGTDTAEFSGARAGYGVFTSGSALVITGEGTDVVLDNVERLAFADGTFGFGQLFASADPWTGDPLDPTRPTGVTLTGTAAKDTLSGGSHDDVVLGLGDRDRLFGGGGADRIEGGDGNDRINAGTGDDSVAGDAGNDRIDGGDGNDLIAGGAGRDRLSGDGGDDEIFGGEGRDKLSGGDGADWLGGDGGADRITGGNGDDVIDGGFDADRLSGSAGADSIDGGAGDDRIIGGSEADTIAGGAGTDKIKGGAGADVFVITANAQTDIIFDFDPGLDRIDVSALGLARLSDFSAVDSGAYLALSHGSVTISLKGVDLIDLGDTDFLF